MSILIVTHDANLAAEITPALQTGGHGKIFSAATPEQAFALLGGRRQEAAEPVDLILLDMVMPGGASGHEACFRIKSRDHLADTPIIAILSAAGTEDLRLAYSAGIIDCLRRPVVLVELLERVNAVLKVKHEFDRRRCREQELIEEKRQLQRANEILRSYSIIDGLTGVVNNRHFEELYSLEVRRARRTKSPLAILRINIDFFRIYNETYGYRSGDECLKRVADALQRRVRRAGDIVARTGGEDFSVLLPETPRAGALHVAEELRQAVLELQVPHQASSICPYVTVSLGMAAAVPDEREATDRLLHISGEMLQRAKQEGRNRVCAGDG